MHVARTSAISDSTYGSGLRRCATYVRTVSSGRHTPGVQVARAPHGYSKQVVGNPARLEDQPAAGRQPLPWKSGAVSAYLVGKLDIDVLVQLALHGPMEARDWVAQVQDPDAFGRALWELNFEATAYDDDDEPLPPCVYEPLPVAVTVVEALVAVAHYGYQTFDEESFLQRPVALRLNALRRLLEKELLLHPPGWHDAPWRWDAAAVVQRRDRPAPGANEVHEDPAATALLRRLRDGGLPLKLEPALVVPGAEHIEDPRDVLGVWQGRPGQVSGFLGVTTYVCRTPEAASRLFKQVRAAREQDPWPMEGLVLRAGTLVHYAGVGRNEYTGPVYDQTVELLAAEGLDERWSILAPSEQDVRVVRAVHEVPVRRFRGDETPQTARTAAGRAALAAQILDEQAAATVTDLEGDSTVLLLHGLPCVQLMSGTQTEVIDGTGLAARLQFDATGHEYALATVVVLDGVSLPVTEVRLHAADLRLHLKAVSRDAPSR